MTPVRVLAVVLLGLAACAPEAAGAAAISAADRAAARERLESDCASCHGMDGKGRGPSAMSLNPPPRDWTDQDWQASVTDADLRIVIIEGGAALGLSSAMPPLRLADQPGVVDALVASVRGFGR